MVHLSSIVEKDRAFVWHPFTQRQIADPPLAIVKGKGVYVYSADGTKYLDGISSWWVNLHGHAHPYIIEKIHLQANTLEHVLFAGFTHAPAVDLAERLTQLLPGKMSKIFYSDNGSTAVEVALKIALQYWHNLGLFKKKVICFKNSYHGDTFGAMSAAGKNHFNRPFWSHLFEVEVIDPPLIGGEEPSVKKLCEILEKEDVACFIFEPLILAAGGMILYSKEGLGRMLELCRERGVLLIADEVMTGFGRTDDLFVSNVLEEKPDLICLSKGITGGFLPLGATACKEYLFEAFLSPHFENAFLHGHSYTANPLACAAALASLDLLLQENCFSKRNEISKMHQGFCKKWREHPRLRRCESIGTLLVLEYREEKTAYFHAKAKHLSHFFLKRHIILRPLGNVLYVLPPFCIEKEELEKIYHTIEETFDERNLNSDCSK